MIPKRPENVIWTPQQWNAIYDEGCNILVSAGAGSGKTAVLTERLTQKVLNRTSLSELIVLTFTKDAASTMKERLRKSLKKKYLETNDDFVKEQLQLIDVSHIQTFDSFTSDLVKSNNYLLDLPIDFKVFDEKYHNIVIDEITKKVIDKLFEENNEHILRLANIYTLKNSDVIKDAVLKIIKKLDLVIDYSDQYISKFFTEEHNEFLLNSYDKILYSKIAQLFKVLEKCQYYTDSGILKHVEKLNEFYSSLKEPTKLTYQEINELISTRSPSSRGITDPFEKESYEKDKDKIKQVRAKIKSLTLKTKEEYLEEYKNTLPFVESFIYIVNLVLKELNIYKKKYNMYTFNDISKLSVKLLKENPLLLNELKYNTKEILVDEYQDTSDVQEALISLISNNNLYLVGDIKQSIYRFRNANPLLFSKKLEEYSKGNGGKVIDLTSNFRSREEVLTDINNIFIPLMEKEFGGVDYIGNQLLSFGNKSYNMYPKPNEYNLEYLTYDMALYEEFTPQEVEIFSIGLDILQKMKSYQIFDKDLKIYRKASFKDFSIILMSKKTFKLYESIFKYLGIPLVTTESSSFIRSEEVVFIKSVLECAYAKCNPTYEKIKYNQSLMSILRSFVYNTSDNTIHENYKNNEIDLRNFNKELDSLLIKYSQLIESTSLSNLISIIYKDFNIYHKIINVGTVLERQKKLEYLYQKSFEFDSLGILEFISYLDYIYTDEELDIEYSAKIDGIDGVTLTTIHKSKGLEYPICYFANLDKKFNVQDTIGSFLYSNDFGLIIPFEKDGLNSTFIKSLFKYKYIEEEISEKIRLFYVALTRAKEKMIFVTNNNEQEVFKEDINNMQHMLTFSADYINNYKKEINIYSNSLFRKDYYKIKKRNLSKKEIVKEYYEISQRNNIINHQRASKQVLKLNTKDTSNVLELGTKFHNVLENISIKNANLGYYDSYLEYNIVRNFLNSDLIKSLDIINEYHEYAYFDEFGNKSIIDLVLETKDYLYLIDYKLSNTDDENYVNQLNQYKSYLKTITNKEIRVYLYSLFKGEFKELI